MNIKCSSCSASQFSFWNYVLKDIPKEGIACSNCGAINIKNPLVFIVPFLAAISINSVLSPLNQPKYILFLVPLTVVFLLTYMLASIKPLILVTNETLNKKPISLKWYTSPIVYLSVFTALILFLFFK